MKFQSILLLIFAFTSSYTYSQRTGPERNSGRDRNTETNYFIQFYSGKKIYGKYISVGEHKFFVDSDSYKSDSIKFYKNNEGYFAHVTPISNIYARRTIEGKVNLFERSDKYYVNSSSSYRGNSFIYYCMGDTGEIRHPRFKYLKKDLSSNEVSLKYINRRNEMTMIQIGCLFGGAAVITYGAISGFTNKEQAVTREGPNPFILSGVILFNLNFVPVLFKRFYLKNAFNTFNGKEPEPFLK